jgi:hypothetical protein
LGGRGVEGQLFDLREVKGLEWRSRLRRRDEWPLEFQDGERLRVHDRKVQIQHG